MNLEFIVENQTLSRDDKNFVVEKSQKYLYAHFNFKSDDWEKIENKYAIFSNEEYKDENSIMVKIENDKVLIPNEIIIAKWFEIHIIGIGENGVYIIPTNKSFVNVNETGATMGLSPNDPKTPYIYELEKNIEDIRNDIEEMKSQSDYVDIVNSYADLKNYDKSKLTENDIIKVLKDETREKAISYYRLINGEWVFVGSSTPSYSIEEIDNKLKLIDDKIPNKIKSNEENNTISLYRDEKEIENQDNKVKFKTINNKSLFGVGNIETAYTYIVNGVSSIDLAEYKEIINAEIVIYAGNPYYRSAVNIENTKIEFNRVEKIDNNIVITKLGFIKPNEGETSLIEQPLFDFVATTPESVLEQIEEYMIANYENGDLGEY